MTARPAKILFMTISVSSWNALNPTCISLQETRQNLRPSLDQLCAYTLGQPTGLRINAAESGRVIASRPCTRNYPAKEGGAGA
jgi:hypothetical protein